MSLGLGIDTGGTYTDAVLLDFESRQVLRKAKALTTPGDLSRGIACAIEALGDIVADRIEFAAVSTTLATNAVVEGRGGRTCLVAIGYSKDLLMETISQGAPGGLPVDEVRFATGGHNVSGQERQPLDLEAVRCAVDETAGQVDAYAVSAHGGVCNSAHEAAVRDLIRSMTGLPVVCGHELTSELDAIRRAVTAVFNARLLPLIRDLIEAVSRVLADRNIRAPLMIVKGDGHMMGAAAAQERPIETLLSGPAASFVGGRYLSGVEDALVVDMGGTTTDVALLRNGVPVLRSDGAAVGGWHTHVRAADISTTGIGGDSHIVFRKDGIAVGPRRAIPLCLAAAQYPDVLRELRMLSHSDRVTRLVAPCDFLVLTRKAGALNDFEERLIQSLSKGPKSMFRLASDMGVSHPSLVNASRLERLGAVTRAGLTPTDVLHAEGVYTAWDADAARLGVSIMARQLGMSGAELMALVCDEVYRVLAGTVLEKLGAELGTMPGVTKAWLLDRMADGKSEGLRLSLSAGLPVVGIGAPAGVYLPEINRLMKAEVIVPLHAEVANAVGAAVGGVAESVEVVVKADYSAAGIVGYTVLSTAEVCGYARLDDAVDHAVRSAQDLARQRALKAGATEVDLQVERTDLNGKADDPYASEIFLETRVRVTAVGRVAHGG